MTKVICTTLSVILALVMAQPPSAGAQTFPTKPVRLICPFPAGSGPDIFMRLIAERLSKLWNESVVLEARAGGNGVPAMEAIKSAAPDGHTLGIVADAQLAVEPALQRKLSYNPQTDFAPVLGTLSTPLYIMVAAKGPYQTMRDLVADAQSATDKVSYGAMFAGSLAHIHAAEFALLINARMVFVPYRDVQQMLLHVVTGDLGWTLSSIATSASFLASGTLRPIAIADTVRSPYAPDIPTIAEAGGPAVKAKPWVGIVAPAGTPAQVIRQINSDFRSVFAEPAIQERLPGFGFTLDLASPEEMRQLIVDDLDKYRDLVKRIGLSPPERP
jgi:tripartite-type tricarboxylate transporter receptor subunit TctC